MPLVAQVKGGGGIEEERDAAVLGMRRKEGSKERERGGGTHPHIHTKKPPTQRNRT
jgi:hypothetical protein